MLNHEQLMHFAEHGWVLEENILTQGQVEQFKRGLDRLAEEMKPHHTDTEDVTNLFAMVNFDRIFRDWIMIPEVLEANRQLMGCEIKYECCHAMIKTPHPDRKTNRDELRALDNMSWHRGLRPKWGTFPHDTDEELIHCTFLNNITCLTDVSPEDGGTMLLDGSHKLEGDYSSLKEKCEVVELTASSGSIAHFSESLIHAGVPILSDNTRYTMFYGFTPSWYVTWPHCEVSKQILETIKNDELREILGGRCGYVKQDPVI